ncbi:MAG TPA: sugar ABC transporter permease [Clostridiaceae bacterium]|jgi:raffinose/stachyose/melibiose transport system permease protein|nr:sugar ABC transporter permease [Clostridiaceae bacterium]
MDLIRRRKSTIFMLVFPGLLVFSFAVLFPIVKSFFYGMTDWKGIGEYNFVGAENYKTVIFNDKVFRTSLLNAALLAAATVFIQHPIAMFYAIAVDKLKGRLETFFRAVFFIPCVISIVITSKMWVNLFNSSYGLVNKFLELVNLGFLKRDWLGNPNIALGSVIFVIMWQGFGYAFLIYYSGIKGVPDELYEASRIDGANAWQQFVKVTLPMLKPVIFVNISIAITASLKQMEPIFIMTNGGPGTKTQFVANYLYTQAFNAKKYGYANAISLVFVVICVIITIIVQKLFRNKEV